MNGRNSPGTREKWSDKVEWVGEVPAVPCGQFHVRSEWSYFESDDVKDFPIRVNGVEAKGTVIACNPTAQECRVMYDVGNFDIREAILPCKVTGVAPRTAQRSSEIEKVMEILRKQRRPEATLNEILDFQGSPPEEPRYELLSTINLPAKTVLQTPKMEKKEQLRGCGFRAAIIIATVAGAAALLSLRAGEQKQELTAPPDAIKNKPAQKP